jgi:excisionase family DNA binding protein
MQRETKDDGGPQLFTASDIARFCQVDLKTIHNWADKGEIKHFRTPGRHLRFRRVDVLEFLRKYGYPIPQQLREGKPRVVIIDEEESTLSSLRRSLGKRFELSTFTDPFEALVALGQLQPEAVLLDVGLKSMDGVRLIERMRKVPSTAHIRVLACTNDESKRNAALDAGAQEAVPRGSAAQIREALERVTGVDKDVL